MKEIPLRNRKKVIIAYALVDDADYDYLMQWRWHCTSGYAKRVINNYENGRHTTDIIPMQNAVMPPPPGHIVDHISRNRLDNQKANLRIATQSGNSKNASAIAATSIYKGVHWHRVTKKWAAKIRANHRIYHLGVYASETDAARVYDHHARRLHGEFAVLNFPNDIGDCPPRVRSYVDQRGELSNTAKLTKEQVIAIRQRYATEQIEQKVLAIEYGISKGNIHCIVTRKSWKHI